MANYKLSHEADADFAALYLYSLQNFGEAQADLYAQGLIDGFETLTDQPLIGRERFDLAPELRCYFLNSHGLYYRQDGDEILIVRILHQSMDTKRQFD